MNSFLHSSSFLHQALTCAADFYQQPLFSYAVEFEVPAFEPEAFKEAGLFCPESIQSAVQKRQAEYFAGRFCAQQLFSQLGLLPFDLLNGEHREPLWPDGIKGSISHSKNLAAAVVCQSPVAGIGLDLEIVMPFKRYQRLADTICSNKEQQLISQNTLPDDLLGTAIFSAKESFYKAAFCQVGKVFGFEAISATVIEKDHIELEVKSALSLGLPPGFRFKVYYQYLPQADSLVTLLVLP